MKTEIFGTFGPACKDKTILKEMMEAGLTGMRLNLSHTTLAASEDYISAYCSVAEELGKTPQILIDMQGPELRVGDLKEAIALQKESEILMCVENDIDMQKYIPIPKEVIEEVQKDDQILLDDGKILVQVEEILLLEDDSKAVRGRICRGGLLQGHKSIKIINKNVKMPPLTQHDLANIKKAKQCGVTALMQPFVLNSEDLHYVRTVLKENDAENIKIFAKIENRLGVENLEDILTEADVIIIARGDLGNDMPLWELPKVQKKIEEVCKRQNKPYIVVTQMLASMENNPVPTRAEVSDIFHAVYHGAWGVMVTGETAVGKYPVETIQYLANTAREAELDLW